jgi:hypothetical protein
LHQVIQIGDLSDGKLNYRCPSRCDWTMNETYTIKDATYHIKDLAPVGFYENIPVWDLATVNYFSKAHRDSSVQTQPLSQASDVTKLLTAEVWMAQLASVAAPSAWERNKLRVKMLLASGTSGSFDEALSFLTRHGLSEWGKEASDPGNPILTISRHPGFDEDTLVLKAQLRSIAGPSVCDRFLRRIDFLLASGTSCHSAKAIAFLTQHNLYEPFGPPVVEGSDPSNPIVIE